MVMKVFRWGGIVTLTIFSIFAAVIMLGPLPGVSNFSQYLLVVSVASALIWTVYRLLGSFTRERRPVLVSSIVVVMIIGIYAGAAHLTVNFLNANAAQLDATLGAGLLTLSVYVLALLKPGPLARNAVSFVIARAGPPAAVGDAPSAASISRGSFIAAGLWGLAMIWAMIDSGAFSPGVSFDFAGFLAFLIVPVGVLFGLDWVLGRRLGAP